MHELKSQMIILPNGYVCHAAIGYQVAVADTTIYRSSGISAFLGQNDMILGDKGFKDLEDVLSPPKRSSRNINPDLDMAMSRDRVRIEQAFGSLKSRWSITGQRPRHLNDTVYGAAVFVCVLCFAIDSFD